VVLAKALLSELSPWTIGLTRMGLGSAVLVAWLFVHGNPSALAHMTSRQWGWVLLTGVILAGYVGTWFAALSRAPAVDVTAVLVVAAVITTVLQAMVNGTPLVPDLMWLGLLVLGGALVLLPTPRRAALASSA
jgi:drug/metabolite transporter (DMT)-like permease